jgi:hypothetical protein
VAYSDSIFILNPDPKPMILSQCSRRAYIQFFRKIFKALIFFKFSFLGTIWLHEYESTNRVVLRILIRDPWQVFPDPESNPYSWELNSNFLGYKNLWLGPNLFLYGTCSKNSIIYNFVKFIATFRLDLLVKLQGKTNSFLPLLFLISRTKIRIRDPG